MMSKKYLAEFMGTITLSFVVLLSLSHISELLIPVPVIAGLILYLFVYTIGSISGAHINPVVTVGLLSIKKISIKEATFYILAQVVAGFEAFILVKLMAQSTPAESSLVFNKSAFLL